MTNPTIATAIDMPPQPVNRRGTGAQASQPSPNGTTNGTTNGTIQNTRNPPRDTKYRHVFATHSLRRTSCLSSDSESSPSFKGFRNLMILVLRMHFRNQQHYNKTDMQQLSQTYD
jgi:diacylglycerol O-acyltransferase-1